MTSNGFSGRRFVLGGAMAAAVAIVAGIAPSIAVVGAEGASGPLAFVPAGNEYHFDTGVLRGTLRENGGSLGLKPLFDVATGTPLAGLFGLFSPYRLLTPECVSARPGGTGRASRNGSRTAPWNRTGCRTNSIPWT